MQFSIRQSLSFLACLLVAGLTIASCGSSETLLQKDLKLDQKAVGPVFTATVQVIPVSPRISQQAYDTIGLPLIWKRMMGWVHSRFCIMTRTTAP